MSKKIRIVILDGYAANPGDLSWGHIEELGELDIYDNSRPDQIIERAQDADYIITNKCELTADVLKQLPKLKCICVLATGYNNIDVSYAREKRIDVCNVIGYSTPSVAQHVFALLLSLTNQVKEHSDSVHMGQWAASDEWSYWNSPLTELASLTMGIYGYGKIGQQVAQIALAFGMEVIATRRSNKNPSNPNIKLVDEKELLSNSDVISLHAPLSEANTHFINQESLKLMKPSSVLINTGRGGLINEIDLAAALKTGEIAAAALDVLSQEPPPREHPLYHLDNCIITPHIAWATLQSRQRLINSIEGNIKAHQKGDPENLVN